MSYSRKIIIIFACCIVSANVLHGQGFFSKRIRTYPLPKATMERLGETALNLAQQKLAVNKKDPMGLLLLNFANHFIPEDRDVLLLRGKLKFKVPFKSPRKKIDDKDFLLLLSQARDHINATDTAMNRHILVILNQLIRAFNPREEEAIISLMKFSDKGVETDVKKLLNKRLQSITDTKYDPKDSRYAIGNIDKTIDVPANSPWTDTWIKVKAGTIIKITAHGTWSMGDDVDFPACDADGYTSYDFKTLKKWSADPKKDPKKITGYEKKGRSGAPGCLLGKIGKKQFYIGKGITYKAETSGVLYLGPYEWGDYLDNYGSLEVNIKIKDD